MLHKSAMNRKPAWFWRLMVKWRCYWILDLFNPIHRKILK